MKTTIGILAAALCGMILATSCEKPVIAEENTDGSVTLRFKVAYYEQVPFSEGAELSRATAEIGELCTRINLALFSGGEKVKTVNQTADSEDFGQIQLSVPAGKYTLVVLAHSGTGNATISSAEEIKFPNNKVTDTFYYCEELEAENTGSYEVKLRRAVAKFQLVTTDKMPDNVKEMTFKYTGGSSTFNALTGYGSVNSRQTEVREVAKEQHGSTVQFDIYTFPHAEAGELKITVTATDEASNAVAEKVFENVPVKVNQITRYRGAFFSESSEGGKATFTLTADAEWTQQEYDY